MAAASTSGTPGRGGRRGRRDDRGDEPLVVAGRVPPHDLDAEAAVLSAAILDPEALDRAGVFLRGEHFYSDSHRLVWDACLALMLANEPVDVVTVASRLRDQKQIERVGGNAYLGQLVDGTPAVANVEHHANIIVAKWRVRRAIALCQRFQAEGYGEVPDSAAFLDALEREVFELNHHADPRRPRHVRDVMIDTFQEISDASKRGGVAGISTGFVDLDKKTSGLHQSDLVIAAGRPAMGKSAFVFNLAVNVASPQQVEVQVDDPWGPSEMVTKSGYGVAIFSLEMPKEQVAKRMVCSESRVDMQKLRQGSATEDDWAAMTSAASFISPLPIFIDDTPGLTVLQLRGKVRPIAREFERAGTPLRLVIIDYLQLMDHEGGGRRGMNREQEISAITRRLKTLAKELNVTVIALSQLNRGVESRDDKRPRMSDLRESGAIEQDADTIIFVYRDEYYHRDTTEERGIAELIIAKQRNGPTGTVRTRFVANCTRFESLAPGEYVDLEEVWS